MLCFVNAPIGYKSTACFSALDFKNETSVFVHITGFVFALRAIEVNAEVILKGTRVDGIYDSDPEKNKEAVKFDSLSFDDVLKKGLKIMDTTAFTLSQENELPIIVFNMNTPGNLLKVVLGEKIGTIVRN